MPFQDNTPKAIAGIYPGDGEALKPDSGVAATDGPLVLVETGHDGKSIGNSGASTCSVALATALTAHHGRLLYNLGGVGSNRPTRGFRRAQVGTISTASATFMDPVYMSDAGAPALTAGTVPKVIGYVQAVGAAQTVGSGVGGAPSTGGIIRLCQPFDMPWIKQQRITAASTALTGTVNTAQTYDKSLSIPARRLFNGVRARVRAVFNVGGQNGTDTHTYTLRIGGTNWITTGAVDSATFGATSTTVGTKIIMEGEIELRAAPGATAAGVAFGRVTYDSVCKTMVGLTTASTFATNAAIAIDAQVTYGAAVVGNTSTLQSLTIDYIDPV